MCQIAIALNLLIKQRSYTTLSYQEIQSVYGFTPRSGLHLHRFIPVMTVRNISEHQAGHVSILSFCASRPYPGNKLMQNKG